MNKDEKQSIYEIYRACRLCGESSGYKMPIIQSIIDADGEEADLQRKIKECVQLEVTLNDRMPPLICEMCVEQINEFYEFREICHNINKRTRLQLGLPLQTVPELKRPREREYSTIGDTKSIYVNTDSEDGEPLSKQPLPRSRPRPKSAKARREADIQIKIQNYQPQLMLKENERSLSPEANERRETRRNRGPSPKRSTKQNACDEMPLSGLQGMQVKSSTKTKAGSKSVLGREKEKQIAERDSEIDEENDGTKSLTVVRQKRLRERENINYNDETPTYASKKTKLSTPEPPKPDKPSKPGPKSFKTGQNTEHSQPKPGPKSKRREPSPPPELPPPQQKAAPKSRKSELSIESVKSKKGDQLPAVKSRRSELSPSPGPRSRKSETLVSTEVKSKKSDLVQKSKKSEQEVQVTKSKQHESSPVLISSSRSRPKRAPPEPTPPPPEPTMQKVYLCNICGIIARAAQGLSSHMKVHVPTFTSAKLSCNACELWFFNTTEATAHHREHTEQGKPYTCGKCYDDFEQARNYELHFARNQCLPTYEVPDVKCEQCWHTYPTYKLLEEHRCQGEGARPGGNCSNCKRFFATQKSLATHEMRCTVVKKKVTSIKEEPVKSKNEPIVDPEVSRSLLPMEVRIIKCDAILKNLEQNNYDVKGISHRFGLDRNSSYPYLYSMGDVQMKTESVIDNLDHMASIKDESDSFVYWDSDDSDFDIDTSFESRTIDKLSTLTLKTLFSPKCLGKVPRKIRNFKNEKVFDSILSIDFPGDIKKNIDSIIDNLGIDSPSDNYDSDSILERRPDKSKSVTDFDNLKESPMEISESRNVEENESHESEKSDLNNAAENLNDEENDTKMTKNGSIDDNTDNLKVSIENDAKVINENDANFDGTTQSNSSEEFNITNAIETKHTEVKTVNDDVTNQNNNENQLKDDEVPEQVAFENESACNEDKVKINSKTGEEKMDIDEQTELETANNANSIITDTIDEINTNENEELPNNNESKNDMNTEDSKISSDTAIDDSNGENNDTKLLEMPNRDTTNENNDSLSSDAVTFERIRDPNDERNHLPSSHAINHNESENMNDLNDDTQSSNTMIETKDDLNAETHDSHLNDDVDRKLINESSNDKYGSQLDGINDKFIEPENDLDKLSDTNNVSMDKISEETQQTGLNFNSLLADEDNLSSNVQITDKFNIDDLNDEEKQLMAELDEQIGESDDLIGRNDLESDLIGENKADDDMIGENRADNINCENRAENDGIDENRADNVNCENRADNDMINENRADNINCENNIDNALISESRADYVNNENRTENDNVENVAGTVISENRPDDFNKNDSNIIIPNVGFSDMDVDENNDSFNTLLKKNDDLTSLDLDSISEEEFDFDA